MTLKQQFVDNFIPAIHQMIEREQEHLSFLRQYPKDLTFISQALDTSNNILIHLQTRLKEYTDYANSL